MVAPFEGSDAPPAFIGIIFILIGGVLVLLGWAIAVCMFISGRNLQRKRHYTFSMVVAGASCLFMPFGTVLGIFTLVVLSKDSVKALFQNNG